MPQHLVHPDPERHRHVEGRSLSIHRDGDGGVDQIQDGIGDALALVAEDDPRGKQYGAAR
jgi:hypothetical protein